MMPPRTPEQEKRRIEEREWEAECHKRRLDLMRAQGSVNRQQSRADFYMIVAAVLGALAIVATVVF
jgi:ribosomal protein S10